MRAPGGCARHRDGCTRPSPDADDVSATWAVYYYRVNYFCLAVLIFIGAFLRHPLAFFAVGCATFTTLCLNDLFSHAVRHAAASHAAAGSR